MPILRKLLKLNSKIKQQQQQQTLLHQKLYVRFKKTKINNKVNTPSDKPKTKQNNL